MGPLVQCLAVPVDLEHQVLSRGSEIVVTASGRYNVTFDFLRV